MLGITTSSRGVEITQRQYAQMEGIEKILNSYRFRENMLSSSTLKVIG